MIKCADAHDVRINPDIAKRAEEEGIISPSGEKQANKDINEFLRGGGLCGGNAVEVEEGAGKADFPCFKSRHGSGLHRYEGGYSALK